MFDICYMCVYICHDTQDDGILRMKPTATFFNIILFIFQGRKGIEQLGDALAELHHQTSEVSKRADFIASNKRSALEQRLMHEHEAAIELFEKREKATFAAQLKKLEDDHRSRVASITAQHM
jgi:hypothetical protein